MAAPATAVAQSPILPTMRLITDLKEKELKNAVSSVFERYSFTPIILGPRETDFEFTHVVVGRGVFNLPLKCYLFNDPVGIAGDISTTAICHSFSATSPTSMACAESIASSLEVLQKMGIRNCTVVMSHSDLTNGLFESVGIPQDADRAISRSQFKSSSPALDQLLSDALQYRGSASNFVTGFTLTSKAEKALQFMISIEKDCIASGVDPKFLIFAPGSMPTKIADAKEFFFKVYPPNTQMRIGHGSNRVTYGIHNLESHLHLTRSLNLLLLDPSSHKQTPADVFIAYDQTNDTARAKALELAVLLRSNFHANVDLYTGDPKVSPEEQMKIADDKGIPYAMAVTDNGTIKFGGQIYFSDRLGHVRQACSAYLTAKEADGKILGIGGFA